MAPGFDDIARRSLKLPLEEIFRIIDEGFTQRVNKYAAQKWEDSVVHEHVMDRYSRYIRMVGKEEFQTIASSIAALRVIHKVCSGCGDDNCNFRLCSGCRLTYYCTRLCQKTHWPRHKLWCNRRYDGILDTGPAKILLKEK
jgi:hypothetical protein